MDLLETATGFDAIVATHQQADQLFQNVSQPTHQEAVQFCRCGQTSYPRRLQLLESISIKRNKLCAVPGYFGVQYGGRKAKRARVETGAGGGGAPSAAAAASILAEVQCDRVGSAAAAGSGAASVRTKFLVAGRNSGELRRPTFCIPCRRGRRNTPYLAPQRRRMCGNLRTESSGSDLSIPPPTPSLDAVAASALIVLPLPHPADSSSGSLLQPPTVDAAGRPRDPPLFAAQGSLVGIAAHKPLDHAALSRRIVKRFPWPPSRRTTKRRERGKTKTAEKKWWCHCRIGWRRAIPCGETSGTRSGRSSQTS